MSTQTITTRLYSKPEISQLNVFSPLQKEVFIEPDKETPFVKFNGEQGVLLIKGHSINANSRQLYRPILTLIKNHFATSDKLTCYFFLKDFNHQTASILFEIFKNLKKYQEYGSKVTINWFADWNNHDMIETGVDFSELFNLNMNIMPI